MAGRQLRFADLQQRNIVKNWPYLKELQKHHGFPLGRMLSPNVRAWDEDKEIDPWLASRPVENDTPLRGNAKTRHERRLARFASGPTENEHPSQGAEKAKHKRRDQKKATDANAADTTMEDHQLNENGPVV